MKNRKKKNVSLNLTIQLTTVNGCISIQSFYMCIFYRCDYNTFSFESYSSFNKHFPHFIKKSISEDHFSISSYLIKRHLSYLNHT